MNMRQKIKSNRGFSLTEMLATVLIVVMVTAAAAGGVTVVRNVYEKVTVQANAQVLLSTVMTTVVDDLRHAENVKKTTVGSGATSQEYWAFDNTKRGYRMYYISEENEAKDDGNIYVQPIGGETIPLVTQQTKTNGLYPQMTALNYENDIFTVSVSIVKDGKTYASQTEIKIRPLNESK